MWADQKNHGNNSSTVCPGDLSVKCDRSAHAAAGKLLTRDDTHSHPFATNQRTLDTVDTNSMDGFRCSSRNLRSRVFPHQFLQ